MKIHLISSSEVPEDFTDGVISLLRSINGPVEFFKEDNKLRWQDDELADIDWEEEEYFHKKSSKLMSFDAEFSMKSSNIVTWPDIFSKTTEYRKNNSIAEDEHIVVLTSHANEYNWFSAGNPNGSYEYFVHTGMWEKFFDCDPRFPVAYELISIPLQVAMFGSYTNLEENSHQKARGCVNDFCRNKKEIVLKMRTGDICQECVDLIISENVDPALVDQAFKVFDSIKSHMLFRERYKITRQPYRLEIRGNNKRFYLPDLSDAKISLSPMERAVYLLVLSHPEGIPISHFPDHQEELKRYYSSTSVEGSIVEINHRVSAICENQDNLLSQILTRIKRKYTDLVGEEMAESYAIKGERGEPRRIDLERDNVIQGLA